jgi:hypothetical protein
MLSYEGSLSQIGTLQNVPAKISPTHKPFPQHTDKKEKKIFLIYKEIQNGAVA